MSENAKEYLRLGNAYLYGIGVQKDTAKSIPYYKKAADLGASEAMFFIGLILFRLSRFEGAAEWFRKAAEQNHAEAKAFLGMLYYLGWGVDVDYYEAAKWLQFSVGLEIIMEEVSQAQYDLGNRFLFGKGVEKNEPLAVKLLELSASHGYVESQFLLGLCYSEGSGVEKDDAAAFKWFEIAASKDSKEAQFMLGFCYMVGVGVERDKEKSLMFIKKAAEQGFALSQWLLGQYFFSCNKLMEAFKLMKESAEQGFPPAQSDLGSFYHDGIGVEKDISKAIYWLEKAANEHVYADSMVRLFLHYYESEEFEIAHEWVTRLDEYEDFHFISRALLGFLYLEGKSVEQDSVKAYELFHDSIKEEDQWISNGITFLGIRDVVKEGLDEIINASKTGNELTNLDYKIAQIELRDANAQSNNQKEYDLVVAGISSALRKVLLKLPDKMKMMLPKIGKCFAMPEEDCAISIWQMLPRWDSNKAGFETYLISSIKEGKGIPVLSEADTCLRINEEEQLYQKATEARKLLSLAFQYPEYYDLESDGGLWIAIEETFPNARNETKERIFNDVRKFQNREMSMSVFSPEDEEGDQREFEAIENALFLDPDSGKDFDEVIDEENSLGFVKTLDSMLDGRCDKEYASAYLVKLLWDSGYPEGQIRYVLSDTVHFSVNLDWLLGLLFETGKKGEKCDQKTICENLLLLNGDKKEDCESFEKKVKAKEAAYSRAAKSLELKLRKVFEEKKGR